MDQITVTLDTNTANEMGLPRIHEASSRLPISFATVTVTDRERGTVILEWADLDTKALWTTREHIPEAWILGETPLGSGTLGGDTESAFYEPLLKVIGNCSFPPPGKRDNLFDGQARQMRDVMILLAHVREKRSILVSNDTKAFGKKDDSRRAEIQDMCATTIMTVDEFVEHCATLRQHIGGEQ